MIFDGKTSTLLHNTWYWNGSNVIVFRMPADTADVMVFAFTTSSVPQRRPCFWKLEGCFDGTIWTMLASNASGVSKQDMIDSTPTTAYTEYNGGVPYLLTNVAWTAGASLAAKVSVAAGAALEFESEQLEIAALEVDMAAGAGTITRFTPVEDGALYLTNLVGNNLRRPCAAPHGPDRGPGRQSQNLEGVCQRHGTSRPRCPPGRRHALGCRLRYADPRQVKASSFLLSMSQCPAL